MTNRADTWLGNNRINPQKGNTEERAYDTARTIDERPFAIVIYREDPPGTTITLAPQRVRIEVMQNVRSVEEPHNQWVSVSTQYVVVTGLKDHPILPDTDIKRGDLFVWNNRTYEVIEFIDTVVGRLQVQCILRPQ